MSFVSRQSHLIDRLLDASKSRRTLDPTGWHPTREVESHMRIAKDGRWFHEGAEIKRQEMVALFASLLRLEGDKHYLVTPVEKAIIEVEDTPFVVVDFELDFELESAGEASRLIVCTNTGDWVAVNTEGTTLHASNSGRRRRLPRGRCSRRASRALYKGGAFSLCGPAD